MKPRTLALAATIALATGASIAQTTSSSSATTATPATPTSPAARSTTTTVAPSASGSMSVTTTPGAAGTTNNTTIGIAPSTTMAPTVSGITPPLVTTPSGANATTTVLTQPAPIGGTSAGAIVAPSTNGIGPKLGAGTVTGTAVSSSDQALLDQVIAALSSDPSLSGAALSVTVSNGSVSIAGTARDNAQADRARSIAAGVAGDSRVSASIRTQG